jgi:phosphoglycerate dehydrogenase-like enzyme
MTGVLASQHVADLYGARISDIAKRFGHSLQVIPFAPAAPPAKTVRQNIEIAFYSRDQWEGCDKTFINAETTGFFATVDAVPNLRWLHVTSAGIDLPMYRPSLGRGVRVTTSSGSNAEPIALTAVTGLLMLARGMPHWLAAQRQHLWAPMQAPDQPSDLGGQTAVIVGMGPIGMGIARILKTLGLRTIGIRRRVALAENFDSVLSFAQIDDVLPDCNWLIIACPLTEMTRELIDARRIGLLPQGARFINISRGEIVDENALTGALARKHLSGAYLDVFVQEPLPVVSPLWELPNVIITPHNCSASVGNFGRGVEIFLRNLEHYLKGEPLENEPMGA